MDPSRALSENFLAHIKDMFIKKYSIYEFDVIESETLNSSSVEELYNSLENKFFPMTDDILEAAMGVEYINQSTVFVGYPTLAENEKKLDYLHISAVLILQNWLINILPIQDRNPVSTMGTENNVHGWMWGWSSFNKIQEIINNLEKNFK